MASNNRKICICLIVPAVYNDRQDKRDISTRDFENSFAFNNNKQHREKENPSIFIV